MSLFRKIFKNLRAQKPVDDFSWVTELNGMDDISAIEYSTRQLNINLKNNIFLNSQHIEAFFLIDDKTHCIIERLSVHYIHIENISFELKERIFNTAFLYHRQIFLIYMSLIDHLEEQKSPALLSLLTRAMSSATTMIKWRYYNFQSAPANAWLQISKLYSVAEKQGLLNINEHNHQNTDEPEKELTTLSSAFINIWMLGYLEGLSFKCQQIEFIFTVLEKWTKNIKINKEYDLKKHLFYVDTSNNYPAKRIRNLVPSDYYRYWCLDSINSKIELCLSFIEFNESPKQQSMQEIVSNKYALETMQILRAEWSRDKYKRQRRLEDRIKTNKTATAAYGLEDTYHKLQQHEQSLVQRGLKHYQGNKSFDERLALHHINRDFSESNIFYVDLDDNSQSNILNESNQGLGLRVIKQANELNLGMLISIFAKEEKDSPRVGVIRSIKPVAGNELQLGIKVFSARASCIEMTNTSLQVNDIASASYQNFNYFEEENKSKLGSITGLYLPAEDNLSSIETLVLPRLEYNNHDVFKINISGNPMLIKLVEITEQHEDWIRTNFTIALESH